MKNLFLAVAVVAMACVGCAKEEAPEPQSLPDLVPIEFGSSSIELTRGVPVDGPAFDAGKVVGVFGTETLIAEPKTSTNDWMANMSLTKTASAWNPAVAHYFKKGYGYSFAAYFPWTAE